MVIRGHKATRNRFTKVEESGIDIRSESNTLATRAGWTENIWSSKLAGIRSKCAQ